MRQLHARSACEARGLYANDANVLTIVDANATPSPSRSYAEAVWRANPQISPSWWRENLGLTHSKLAYDGRTLTLAPRLFTAGVNLLLTTPETMPSTLPEGVSAVLETTRLETAAEYILLPVGEIDEAALLQAFTMLESRFREGTLQAYGVALHEFEAWPLNQLLAVAASAAEQVWGRKRRPGLRLLSCPLDVLDYRALFSLTTEHKGEAVSVLELVARLGLWMIATPQVWPGFQASPAALGALTTLAETEARLHQQWQGQWPHVAGQPIFSVLAALRAGQAPWPTPIVAAAWQHSVWPRLQTLLQSLPEASPLLAQWRQTLPYIPELAKAAAAPLAQAALQQLALPEPWASLNPTHQQLALLASVPGVGAVVMPPGADVTPLQSLPDLPDVGGLLAR